MYRSGVREPSADHQTHAAKVARVAAALAAHVGPAPVSFRKRSVSHQVPKRADALARDATIDLGDLDEILSIDREARVCVAEPGVTFEKLVRATLPLGLAPAVVPELRTITIGGAVSGCSLESMSFQYGGFHDTALAYEVITARGEVLECTPENEHALIFQMVHGGFGTLGVVSKLTFRLVPAEPFVHVLYEHHTTLTDYLAAIRRHASARDVDFMDGIIHGPRDLVLSVGRWASHAPYTHRYDWTRVYYESTRTRREDFLRAEDYFFRYDHGVTNVHPKSYLGRLFLGRFLGSERLLRLANRFRRVVLPRGAPTVTLDLFVPISRVPEYLAWHEAELGFFPLWCVPYRRVRDYEWIAPETLAGVDDDLFIDLAIYGMKQPEGRNVYAEIEEELQRVQGLKTLISYNHYDEATFWRIFNKANYDRVKARTDPNNVLRDLYEKTCLAPRGLSRSDGARGA